LTVREQEVTQLSISRSRLGRPVSRQRSTCERRDHASAGRETAERVPEALDGGVRMGDRRLATDGYVP
jgi:hypothetical protein